MKTSVEFLKYHASRFGWMVFVVGGLISFTIGTFAAGIYVGNWLYPILGYGVVPISLIIICLIAYVGGEIMIHLSRRQTSS